jgi:hypothetical protein
VWTGAHPTEVHRLKSVPLPQDVIRILSAAKKRPKRS